MDSCELLTKSIEVFQERGWCRGRRENADGEVCAYGALSVVLTGRADASLSSYYPNLTQTVAALREVYKGFKGAGSSDPTMSILGINERIILDTPDAIAWFEKAKEIVC